MRLVNQKEWEERKKLNKLFPFVATKKSRYPSFGQKYHVAKGLI